MNKLSILRADAERLSCLCQKYDVRELSLFGSVVRDEQREDSDVDLLVEFDPHSQIGFIAMNGLSEELSALFHRPVDLVVKRGLKSVIRERVLAEAEVVFAR